MSKAAKKSIARESDNVYFLKVLVYVVLGMLWIKINGRMILPIGLIGGVLLAQHDHFAIDRKIEYAVLIVSSILALWGAVALLDVWF